MAIISFAKRAGAGMKVYVRMRDARCRGLPSAFNGGRYSRRPGRHDAQVAHSFIAMICRFRVDAFLDSQISLAPRPMLPYFRQRALLASYIDADATLLHWR